MLVDAETFHARSLAALESTRGRRDDAFRKQECARRRDNAFFTREPHILLRVFRIKSDSSFVVVAGRSSFCN
jgi:hypothetical protein